jgi:hypothetical protein
MRSQLFVISRTVAAAAVCVMLVLSLVSMSGYGHDEGGGIDGVAIPRGWTFNRIAAFPAFRNTDVGLETIAEIAAASVDGNTLIYTDGKTEKLGFVDITDPANPIAAGTAHLPGEPTSVAVHGQYALAVVNSWWWTSPVRRPSPTSI